MIAELDCVALTVALPEHGLAASDMGTVVHACKEGRSFTVEFSTYDGTTVALAKVAADQIRLLDWADMQEKLAELFGRPVDLVSRRAIERSRNRYRKHSILSTATPIYGEGSRLPGGHSPSRQGDPAFHERRLASPQTTPESQLAAIPLA